MRGSQPWKTNRARVLRSKHHLAEDKLWRVLRGRQLGGLKFVRQAPVGDYFADFLCREKKVIVEIDGATHATITEQTADRNRAAELEVQGYRIYRVTNRDVVKNIEGVCESLLAFIDNETES